MSKQYKIGDTYITTKEITIYFDKEMIEEIDVPKGVCVVYINTEPGPWHSLLFCGYGMAYEFPDNFENGYFLRKISNV